MPGPVFCQLLMADEINRASPRTQSALLQAMQEQRVAVGGVDHALPAPFHVLATQNPIEQEGTYPLPEAQLDRFLLQVEIGYPGPGGRAHHAARHHRREHRACPARARRGRPDAAQALVRRVPVGEKRGGRHPDPGARRPAGDRTGRSRAPPRRLGPRPARRTGADAGLPRPRLLDGRLSPSLDDVAALAQPVLRHRMALNFSARAEGVVLADVIDGLVGQLG